MRVNYMEPTTAEIGDPFAKLAQVAAFRRRLAAPRLPRAPTVSTIQVIRQVIYINAAEDHPSVNRPEFVDGKKCPYSSHAYLPPGGDWHIRQREKWAENQPALTLTVAQCVAYISQAENISTMDILGPWRQQHIVEARQRAMWLSRRYGDREKSSLPAIGRRFGGRDHTTVLHAFNKMEARVKAGEWVPPTIEQVAAGARNVGVVA